MPSIMIKCKKCGNEINVDDQKSFAICEKCGEEILINADCEEEIVCPHCKKLVYVNNSTETTTCKLCQKAFNLDEARNLFKKRKASNTFSIVIIGIVSALVLLFFINGFIGFWGAIATSKTTCDYCGEQKNCSSYHAQRIAGYESDGSIKYKYDTLWLCSDCVSKAKSSGKYLNIKSTK